MAVHVVPQLGVAIYRFRFVSVLTPARLDRSTGRLARWLSYHLVRGQRVLVEDLV